MRCAIVSTTTCQHCHQLVPFAFLVNFHVGLELILCRLCTGQLGANIDDAMRHDGFRATQKGKRFIGERSNSSTTSTEEKRRLMLLVIEEYIALQRKRMEAQKSELRRAGIEPATAMEVIRLEMSECLNLILEAESDTKATH